MKKCKLLSLFVALTLSVGCISGCGPKKSGKVEVSVNMAPGEAGSPERQAFEKTISDFMAENPDIVVTGEPWQYTVDQFLPRAAGGQLTTAYRTFFTEVQKLVNEGYAADITDVVKENGIYDKLTDTMKKQIEVDGKIYGFPEGTYAMGLAYNAELFEKAGLVDENGMPKIPQTYDELTETAAIIKEKTGQAGFGIATMNNNGGWHLMNIAWSNGVSFMENIDGKWVATYDCPEFIETLQWYSDLKWKYDAIPDNTLIMPNKLYEMVGVGQLAMCFSPSLVADSEAYGTPKEKMGLARVPAGKVSRTTQLGGAIWLFNPDASEEEIKAIIKYFEYRGTLPSEDEKNLIKSKEAWAASAKAKYDQNKIIGFLNTMTWKDVPEYYAAYDEAVAPYKNYNEELCKDYLGFEDVTLHTEEPVCCQELYKELDSLLQEILTNPKADIAALVSASQKSFQENYLDKYEG